MVTALQNSTVTALNNLSTSPELVITANPSRTRINFHAPGAIDIYVGPTQVLSNGGNATLTPSLAAFGGTYHIFAGGDREFTGALARQAFQAFSASSSAQPLTIEEGFQ